MKVRATQDGVYAGYYRNGPVDTENGRIPGEVFEIDDTPFPILDVEGKPVMVAVNEGKQGRPRMEPKMGTWFAESWMEKVSDDTPLTAELDPKFDYPPFQIPIQYRERKVYSKSKSVNPQAPTAVI